MFAETELHLPGNVTIAGGVTNRVGEVARASGMSRVVVVTDPHMAEHGAIDRVVSLLENEALATAVYAEVQSDPTVDNVEGALDVLRAHEADGLVAVGGGSPIDTAKAAAVMATNGGSISDYAGYHRIGLPGLSLIALPTTAGTGSEVTRVSVITDSDRNVKMMLLDNHLLCNAALVDYELTFSCPPSLTAHVGVDSLTHAIEAYVSRRANPVTDMWALEAMRLIAENLRVAFTEPERREGREAMALAATLAGMAFSNASVALVHGMSRPLGVHFHLSHGLSNAVLLPEVTRFSLPGAPKRYAQVARQIGVATVTDPDSIAGAG